MIFPVFENIKNVTTLYSAMLEPVLEKYGLTKIELDIILFLAHHPRNDTAKDITEMRRLTKSHVSCAVEMLAENGYIDREKHPDNKKLIHLKLTEKARPVIKAGEKAQKEFFSVLSAGFDKTEEKMLLGFLVRINKNIEEAHLRLDMKKTRPENR